MSPRRLLPALLSWGLPCVLGLLLVGCSSSSGSGPGGRRMSFASMQAINPGVEGDWIVAEYPYARNVGRRPDGSLQTLKYQIEDPQGKGRPLTLHFDQTGMLVRKQYGGPLLRPPASSSVDFDVSGTFGKGSSQGSSKPDPSNATWNVPGGYVSSRNLPVDQRRPGAPPATRYGPTTYGPGTSGTTYPPTSGNRPPPPTSGAWRGTPGTPGTPAVPRGYPPTPPRPPPPPLPPGGR